MIRRRIIVVLCALSFAVGASAQDDTVSLYLPFDGAVNAGNVKPRVYGEPTYTKGIRGEAVVVGGKARLVYPGAEHFDPTQGACSFWAAPVDWTPQVNAFQFLVSFLSGSANTDLLLYKIHHGPTLTMLVRNDGVKVRTLDKPIVSWRRGQWHHVAATWGADGYRFYVDGERVGERPAIELPPAPWLAITVGTAYPHWGMLGEKKTAIDDLRIYSKPLSAEQILKQFTVQRDASDVLRREAEERRAMIDKIRTSNLAQAARGAVVFTSSFADYKAGYSDNLIDGDLDSVWRSFDDELPQWIELRWAYPVRVSSLAFTEIAPSHITAWSMQAWDRIGAWHNVVDGKGDAERVETAFDEIEADRLRLMITGNDGPATQISEIEVYGPEDQVNVGALRPFWHGWHIWHPEPEEKVIMAPRYFRGTFDVGEGEQVRSAFVQLYTNDLYEVYVNGTKVAEGFKAMGPVAIGEHVRPGRNCLAVMATPTSQPRWTHMAVTCDVTLNTTAGTRYVASDRTWKTSTAAADGWLLAGFDDGGWSAPLMIAPVGKAVWGRLSYADVAARDKVVLRKVELPTVPARPGDSVLVRLHLRPVEQLKHDHVLVWELADTPHLAGWGEYDVCRGTLLPGAMTQWPTDRDTVIEFNVPLPAWAPHGSTPLRIEGLNRRTGGAGLELVDSAGRRIDQVGAIEVDRVGGKITHPPTKPVVRVTVDRPTKAFAIGDQVVSPLVHAYMRPSYERLHLSATTGIHLYQARAYPVQFDGTAKQFDLLRRVLEQHIENAIRIDDQAKIIVFLDMRPAATWRKRHPEAALLTAAGKHGPQSYFAREHEQMAAGELRKLVQYLEAQPYASRIFAYHLITCGTPDSVLGGVEDNLFVKDRDKLTLGDYNPQAIDAFRRWLRKRHPSVDALRRAWRSDDVTFDTATPINNQLTAMGAGGGVFRDPTLADVGTMPTDYFEFLSGGILRFYLKLAEVVKQETNHRALVGVYYGYDVAHLRGYNAVGGVVQNNNFEQDQMMTTQLVDYWAMVPSYGHRWAGSHYESQHSLASLQLHDRGFMSEMDTRTHTAVARAHGRQRSVRESVEVLKRDMATLMMTGYGGWFADWTSPGTRGVGYFMDPKLRDVMRRAKQIYDDTLDRPRDSRAEIAVFISGRTWFHHDVRLAPPIYNNLVARMMFEELPKLGTPYDIYRFEDLADPRVRQQYKLLIFVNPFVMDESDVATIQSLRRDGKAMLWFYAPGYVYPQRGLDVEHIRRAAGLSVAVKDDKERMAYRVTDTDHSVTRGITADTAVSMAPYGYAISNELHPPEIGPVFYVDDKEARTLGVYPDGRSALAVKDRSVYSAVPYMDRALLRNVAAWAGVHLYSDAGPIVLAAGDMVMIHVGHDAGDMVTVRLPQRRRVTDLFTNRQIAEFADRIVLPARRCNTFLLRCE